MQRQTNQTTLQRCRQLGFAVSFQDETRLRCGTWLGLRMRNWKFMKIACKTALTMVIYVTFRYCICLYRHDQAWHQILFNTSICQLPVFFLPMHEINNFIDESWWPCEDDLFSQATCCCTLFTLFAGSRQPICEAHGPWQLTSSKYFQAKFSSWC